MSSKKEAKKGFMPIKLKILTIVGALVSVLVIVLVIIAYMSSRKTIQEKSVELLNSSISNQGAQIESWLSENLTAFNVVKGNVELMGYTPEQEQQLLDSYYGKNANYPDGFYIGSSTGEVVQASDVEKKKVDASNAQWYKEGLTRVNMAFGKVHENEAGNQVVSATGILNMPGDVVRVIGADVPTDHLAVIVNSYINMDNAQAVLVNKGDYAVLSSSDDSIAGNLSDSDEFQKALMEKIKKGSYGTTSINKNLVGMKEIAGTDWVLVSYVAEKYIYADINALRRTLSIVGLIILLILLVLIERATSVIIKPIQGLTDSFVKMATGDFTIDIKAKSNDEIGVMSNNMQSFVKSMRSMIKDITHASEMLQGQADASSTVSGELYSASLTQNETIGELNDTVEQLSQSVQEIAENATSLALVVSETREDSVNAGEKMQETVEVSESGKRDMQRVADAMSSIQAAIHELQDSINQIGVASNEINDIVGMIGEIADETNLLALNASIEAARAGEAGRGFAVVASEIGGLAENSNASVQKIQTLINQVTMLVRQTVDKANASVDQIVSSGALVQQAEETFDKIYANIQEADQVVSGMVENIEKVESVATNMAAITEEQAASAEVISGNSSVLATKSQDITSDSEKVSDTAKELADTSDNLMEQIKTFQV